jgi:hypothetical protein
VPHKSPSKQSLTKSPSKQSIGSVQLSSDLSARPHTPPSSSPHTSPTRMMATLSPTRRALPSSPKSLASAMPDVSNTDRGRPAVASEKGDSGSSYATLPKGLSPMEAAIMLPEFEKETLRKQACSQAERFEVLGARHVSNLSQVRLHSTAHHAYTNTNS